jgi:hypothetical protein
LFSGIRIMDLRKGLKLTEKVFFTHYRCSYEYSYGGVANNACDGGIILTVGKMQGCIGLEIYFIYN